MSEQDASHPSFEPLQAQRTMTAEQANREMALRQALSVLDGKNDDHLQPYVEILRRLHEAIGREMARDVAPQG